MAVASEVDIVNLALVMLGEERIRSLDDNVKAAREAKAIFSLVRNQEIDAHKWKFALRRKQLAALANKPLFGYDFQYVLPEDYCGLIAVGDFYPGVTLMNFNNTDQAAYVIERSQDDSQGQLVLLTDFAPPLNFRYVAVIEDVSLFTETFVDALSYKLAMKLCTTLRPSNPMLQLLQAGYRDAIARAINGQAIEKPPEPIGSDTWVLARFTGV